MNVSIAIYEVRRGKELEWRTIGLGPHDILQVGRSEVRLQSALTTRLKKTLAKLPPADQWWFDFPVGVTLERPHLDVAIREGGKRRTVSGRFPVVVVPHWVADGERRSRLFHPARPGEWAWLHTDHPLEEQAEALFRRAWAPLDAEEAEALQTEGKDTVRRVAFSAPTRSIIDGLEEKAGIWDDLDVDPLRQKKRNKKKKRGLTVLPALATDVTARVLERTDDLGVRRQPYANRMEQLLCGGQKRSTVVIGPPGVGKTTIIRRAVHDLTVADGYAVHRNLDRIHHVWQLSGRRVIAGMSHLGDWEERCVALLEDARTNPVILWFDDIAELARLGRTRDSERNLAEFFRGPVARGEVTVIAEATPERWQRLEAEAPSFAASFARTVVGPTDAAETLSLLFRESRTLERRERVTVDPLAFKTILDLGTSLFPESALPGSALDLLTELVRAEAPSLANVQAHIESGHTIAAIRAYRQARTCSLREAKDAVDAMSAPGARIGGAPGYARRLGGRDVLAVLSDKTGLPTSLLELDRRIDPDDISRTFRRQVIGQEPAVAAARDLLLRIRAGLTPPGRPYAVYLLTGPTGTGKTELAKAIAAGLYGDPGRLLRFDMSELAGPDAVARLIGDEGAPEGMLTSRVREQRFCVILFDEIEKAHPAVLQLMLQLFDEGRLTDAAGETADFTHSVVIMTSNLGAQTSAPLGFARDPHAVVEQMMTAVRDFFPPELFNRIDRVVPFAPLGEEAAMQIARKELRQLLGRSGLVDRRIWATPTRSVVRQVVDRAFTPRDGARPVKRYLEDRVGSVLTEHLCQTGNPTMRLLRVYVKNGEFAVHSEALVEAEATPGRFALAGMNDASREAVTEALREEAPFLRRDDEDSARAKLERAIGDRMREGRTDGIYEFELARQSLEELRDRVEDALAGMPRPGSIHVTRGVGSRPKARGRTRHGERRKPPTKAQALALLAETTFLKRVLLRNHAEGSDRHAVFLEFLRVGEGASKAPRNTAGRGQDQLSWLVQAYREARGECEDVAARHRGEAPLELPEEPKEALDAATAERPDHLVIKVVGLHVVDFFVTETGCHVWSSLRAGTDVIRVRAFPAGAQMSAKQVLDDHVTRRRAFDAALESGMENLPENPESLLPIVRAIHFDPPREAHQIGSLSIEDYALSEVREVESRSPVEALGELLRMRMTRVDEATDG